MNKEERLDEFILNPSCSETVEHIGVKKEDIPFIMKRVKELTGNQKEIDEVMEHFNSCIDKPDNFGDGWISEGTACTYDRIKDDLLVKRDNNICPFCKEKKDEIKSHIKEEHYDEIKKVVKYIEPEEYEKLKKEITLDNL